MANKEKPRRLQALRAIDPLDFVGGVGLGLLTSGVWQIHRPSAFIVCGSILLIGAIASVVISGRRQLPTPAEDKRRG